MAWVPTLLEDSVDPWLALEPDSSRRRAVLEFLIDLRERRGHVDGAIPVPGTKLPAFAAAVPDVAVVIVWVLAAEYEQIAVRYLYDVLNDRRFGG
jgi:hypothetical protein